MYQVFTVLQVATAFSLKVCLSLGYAVCQVRRSSYGVGENVIQFEEKVYRGSFIFLFFCSCKWLTCDCEIEEKEQSKKIYVWMIACCVRV